MRLFKSNKKSIVHPRAEVLAGRIAEKIVRRQTRIAICLNRKTQYWNTASKVIALLVFCLLFGGACLYLVIKAIY
jgi:hypothetical protein